MTERDSSSKKKKKKKITKKKFLPYLPYMYVSIGCFLVCFYWFFSCMFLLFFFLVLSHLVLSFLMAFLVNFYLPPESIDFDFMAHNWSKGRSPSSSLGLSCFKAGFSFCDGWSIFYSFGLLGVTLPGFPPRSHLLTGTQILIRSFQPCECQTFS